MLMIAKRKRLKGFSSFTECKGIRPSPLGRTLPPKEAAAQARRTNPKQGGRKAKL